MASDPPQPSETAEESGEQTSRVRLWLLVLAVLALGGIVEVIIYGYLERPGWIGSSGKQFWDYLELLIVPAALAFGVYWLNRTQDERQQEADRLQQQRQQEADRFQHRLQLEHNEMQQNRGLEVATQQARDAALRAYLDQMSQLMLQPRSIDEVAVSTLARARTLTVLPTLDANRKRSVLQFLYEAGLIYKGHPIVDLTGAELRGIDLHGANLSGADLSDSYLGEADLSGADLSGAILRGADLFEAKGVTNEQLSAASSLEGATMPDGQILKSDDNPDGPTLKQWLRERE